MKVIFALKTKNLLKKQSILELGKIKNIFKKRIKSKRKQKLNLLFWGTKIVEKQLYLTN